MTSRTYKSRNYEAEKIIGCLHYVQHEADKCGLCVKGRALRNQ